MAQRKSARMVQARARARELARADLQREEKLLELAAEFFTQWENVEKAEQDLRDDIARLEAELATKIDQARKKSEAKTLQARQGAGVIARRMAEAGLTQRKVSERLGLSAATVRGLMDAAAEPQKSTEPVSESSEETHLTGD